MVGGTKQLLVFLALLGLVVADTQPFSSNPKQSKSLNEPDVVSTYKRFKDTAPTVVKILQVLAEIMLVFAWLLDNVLSFLLWALNQVVRASSDFSYKTFTALFHIVKLLEYLGFGIKFILELNFSMVSSVLHTVNACNEYLRHAFTLVKISLANETEHVYESGSMMLEGVQSVFVTMCWSRIVAVWDKVVALVSAIIDNFDGFPKPNLKMMASSMVAATTFFLESLVITGGVISDGLIFLLCFIGEVFSELHSILVKYTLLTLAKVFTAITTLLQYLVLLITLPFSFFASLICNIFDLLYRVWQTFTDHCQKLDETVRSAIQISVIRLSDLTTTVASEMTEMISLYVPGGVYGFVMFLVGVTLVYIWRKDIVSLFRIASLYLANISNILQDSTSTHEDIGETVVQHANPYDHEPHTSYGGEFRDPGKLVYELEKEKDKRLCVICQDKVKNVLLLPCRHVCLCERCYQEVRHSRVGLVTCPLCRERVQSTIEVFV